MAQSAAANIAKQHANRGGVKRVVLGDLSFPTWYHSIYPEELVSKDTEILYVCRWCFRYTCDAGAYASHVKLCDRRTTPPGEKVYEHGGYAVWEIDGEDDKLFAQNLSLFAKLFLDHKSVFFDVSSFLYYVLTFTDPKTPDDYYVLGYFSKEKLSWDLNNLACILIFPPYQHKKLGKLLMGVSYKLSAWEWEGGLIGGPERPLSELGRRSYTRFWEERMARYFLLGPPGGDADEYVTMKTTTSGKNFPPRERMTVREIGQATGMLPEDVITALKGMGVVEPEKQHTTRTTSKRAQTTTSDGEAVIIRKSNVLEWTKIHNAALRDPVREYGFIGEWAPEKLQMQEDH
ncbi:histone acetyltransferase (MysT1), putative [Talaromyces stipitatus ATCC 10500]|uniref:histone acetyltransferase n=1 Tax=Talaromyces stipitatus (strain ATCC 10500 / CBS 375.48 / QM 6759 / NRRL 1006) TaxID=441959 RepID=B8M776_TALSN|nr:histone acetyltransferase (MysT1), putative [Talaromyces stipitatus ATCC 10500]EED20296.1 histone acetyltransferase (MysT1), putative [Talaromyces stipitatus ATCC 10500]